MTDNISSEQYRYASREEGENSEQIYADCTPSAMGYAHDHGISLDEAYNHVLAQAGYDAEEVKWTRVPLNDTDSAIGAEIKGKKISVVCNSMLKDGLYNDTYLTAITGENSTSVTFRQLKSQYNTHSGDKHTPYGLRHVMDCGGTPDVDTRMFVLSAPWIVGKKDHVQKLSTTQPILEIRVDNDGELRRYIIPQDFSGGERYTACASAMVTWDGEFWKVKILQKFINGYADDVQTSISDLKQINFEDYMPSDDVPSVICGNDDSSFVDIDDFVSSMPSIVYSDDVPSFVPSDCYSNPVIVDNCSSGYQVEF